MKRAAPRRSGADLHVHTTHSDGACSPCEVVLAAASVGLRGLSVTDHDALSAIPVARSEAERAGIELITGIEITAEHAGREIHILGYFFDETDPDLVEALQSLRSARSDRVELMVSRLVEAGARVDLEAIRRAFPRAALGRKHLADWLFKTGQVASFREAFRLHLGDGGAANVPKPRLPARRAFELIRGAGGVASLAHPPFDLRESTLRELISDGLEAIEVAGPGVGPRRRDVRRARAESLGLSPTAGTDFHAPDRAGRWIGAIVASDSDVERLRERSEARRRV